VRSGRLECGEWIGPRWLVSAGRGIRIWLWLWGVGIRLVSAVVVLDLAEATPSGSVLSTPGVFDRGRWAIEG